MVSSESSPSWLIGWGPMIQQILHVLCLKFRTAKETACSEERTQTRNCQTNNQRSVCYTNSQVLPKRKVHCHVTGSE